jgi:hypothetical protein
VRQSLGIDKIRIDLVSYPCPWGVSATVGKAASLGFWASYPRFMTLMFLVQQITSKVYFLSYSSDEKVACKRILEKKGLSGFQVT